MCLLIQPMGMSGYVSEQNLRWKWNYGSMYNYRNWKNGEPNNINNEYCGELAVETKFISWNDAPCCTQNHFMCKFKT
ncbi:C-type lectin 1-like [Xenopus laevis]|uniref:C-type lectin 1-like n=1 Tax=Xenopus laevis TaxID=8355 RepID=A0A8J1MMC3_XENLA|nr:C-type lectin 1-like [Xenopus laevis]